jgi:hypothetical protein
MSLSHDFTLVHGPSELADFFPPRRKQQVRSFCTHPLSSVVRCCKGCSAERLLGRRRFFGCTLLLEIDSERPQLVSSLPFRAYTNRVEEAS